ncbi:MAG: RHS repeat-associated core domain-containing protein, partial [Treponema sp.]|nr:RHS repeat-associated core domain-containing protein [Treponema sp.]
LWIDWKGDSALEDSTPFRFTGKEMDAETGFYYYGARYLDPKTSRWISADPALGEYVPSAPVDEEAKKRNGNLPGMGGVFNYVNLHVYHYAGNNPVKYTDPDGRKQNIAQKLLTVILATIAKTEKGGEFIKNITTVTTTRNYYEGLKVSGYSEKFYKDKTSVKVAGIPLNTIQTQSTVDSSGYSASEAMSDDTTYDAKVGQSGATNPLIKNTIQIDRDNFFHRPKNEKGKPDSGGCVIPPTVADADELNQIVKDLGFKKDNTIKWKFTKPREGTPNANLD